MLTIRNLNLISVQSWTYLNIPVMQRSRVGTGHHHIARVNCNFSLYTEPLGECMLQQAGYSVAVHDGIPRESVAKLFFDTTLYKIQ